MSSLHLGEKQSADYGSCYTGEVETEDRSINVTWREPLHPDLKGNVYIMVNGWLTRMGSMELPAEEAVRHGNIAVTFDYTNKGTKEPLDENTQDLVAIFDALPKGLNIRAVGLSMGGRVLTRALAQTTTAVEVATPVASAGFISGELFGWGEVATHFAATLPELMGIIKSSPLRALFLGAATVSHCIDRREAVISELRELVQGDEHGSLRAVKAQLHAPYFRFMYGDSDKLLPAMAQETGIEGLPFDYVEMYEGGHTSLLHDPTISRRILRLDSELPIRHSLRSAA